MTSGLKLEQQEDDIPPGWERVAIDEVSTIGGGKTPSKSNEAYWDGSIPWVSPKDFDGVTLDETEDNLTQQGVAETSVNLYEAGDIAMVVRSGVLRHSLPVARLESEMAVNQDIKVLQPDTTKIDSDYLLNILIYEADRIRASCVKTGTTVESVETAFLKAYKLPLPPLSEQRRITNILSIVDEQIQQTDEIIETTKELRHGLRQDLVFGEGFAADYKSVRFGARDVEIPSNWGMATFSDIAAVEKGNTPKTSNSDYYGGDIVWVTPDDLSNMYERGEKYISDSRRKITDAGLQSTSVNIVPAPSVMFTSRSYGIGKTAICTVPAATNQGIIAFHPSEKIGAEYLYYYLNQIMDYIIAISGVSNFPEVSLTDIRNLRVPVPSEDDRERIESVLKLVDERLVEEQNTKRDLQELKRGLMQDLLTGKVRVSTN